MKPVSDRQISKWIGRCGGLLFGFSFAMVIVGIWTDPRISYTALVGIWLSLLMLAIGFIIFVYVEERDTK